MRKQALLPFGGDLVSTVPYGLMWYGNTLAAPWPSGKDEEGNPLPPKELSRQRMRALLKGVIYSGAGYAATRLAFPEDFGDKKVGETGIVDKVKELPMNLVRSQVPEFLLPKAASYTEKEMHRQKQASAYLIRSALSGD